MIESWWWREFLDSRLEEFFLLSKNASSICSSGLLCTFSVLDSCGDWLRLGLRLGLTVCFGSYDYLRIPTWKKLGSKIWYKFQDEMFQDEMSDDQIWNVPVSIVIKFVDSCQVIIDTLLIFCGWKWIQIVWFFKNCLPLFFLFSFSLFLLFSSFWHGFSSWLVYLFLDYIQLLLISFDFFWLIRWINVSLSDEEVSDLDLERRESKYDWHLTESTQDTRM